MVLKTSSLIFFNRVICNKQIITCLEPDIVFIHEFLIPYRERASLRASEQYGIKKNLYVSGENHSEMSRKSQRTPRNAKSGPHR